MKKERKILLALLLIFVCGLALFVFVMFGENIKNTFSSNSIMQSEESKQNKTQTEMQTITVVGIGDLMLPDMEPAEINTKTEEKETVVSSPKIAPLVFDSYEEMEQARANTDPEDAPFLYDYCDLFELEHYYLPVYAERNYELTAFSLDGGASGIVFLSYYFEEASDEAKGKNLTLQMSRNREYGEALFRHSITGVDAIPYEPVEGVYYHDVYNPSDHGELSLTQFFWVHDGYSFMMQVYPGIMEYIKKNDPEALNGALFELEKIEVGADKGKTDADNNKSDDNKKDISEAVNNEHEDIIDSSGEPNTTKNEESIVDSFMFTNEPPVSVYVNGEEIISNIYAKCDDIFRYIESLAPSSENVYMHPQIPTFEYSFDFDLNFDEGVTCDHVFVYDVEMQNTVMISTHGSLSSLDFLAKLPQDTYYVGIAVKKGDDMKTTGYEYLFKMIKSIDPVYEIPEPDTRPEIEPDIQPDIDPDSEPDTEQIDRSNTIAFSAPMYVYSYEELEKAIADSYSGQNSYAVQQLEHYYIPTYASKWCDLGQIYSNNPMSYTVRYSLKEEFGERNSYAEPWDLTMTITVDEKAAIEDFQFFTTQASFKPYEACEGVYYSSYTHSGSEEVIQFLWMKDGCLFFMNIYSALLLNIKENDPEALKSTVFELEKVKLENISIQVGTAVRPDHGIAAAKEQAKENKTAFWYKYDLEELTHYYIPVYAKNNCELTISIFYGGSDGVIYSTYDYAETPKPDMALEFDRETNCGEEYLETAIRRYNLQPYEDCEGVYYVAYPSSSTYFFWLHEGHAFMLNVLPEFVEYLNENDPDALKGALFELEKVELK